MPRSRDCIPESPAQCTWDNCNVIIKRKKDLNRHMKTHTGGDGYKCELCDYSPLQKYNLKAHYKARHPEHEYIGYPCPDCKDGFDRANELNKHRKEFHTFKKQKQTSKRMASKSSKCFNPYYREPCRSASSSPAYNVEADSIRLPLLSSESHNSSPPSLPSIPSLSWSHSPSPSNDFSSPSIPDFSFEASSIPFPSQSHLSSESDNFLSPYPPSSYDFSIDSNNESVYVANSEFSSLDAAYSPQYQPFLNNDYLLRVNPEFNSLVAQEPGAIYNNYNFQDHFTHLQQVAPVQFHDFPGYGTNGEYSEVLSPSAQEPSEGLHSNNQNLLPSQIKVPKLLVPNSSGYRLPQFPHVLSRVSTGAH